MKALATIGIAAGTLVAGACGGGLAAHFFVPPVTVIHRVAYMPDSCMKAISDSADTAANLSKANSAAQEVITSFADYLREQNASLYNIADPAAAESVLTKISAYKGTVSTLPDLSSEQTSNANQLSACTNEIHTRSN